MLYDVRDNPNEGKTTMTEFTVTLAETPVRVRAIYESTKDFCADYLSTDPAAEEICITEEDIAAERKHASEDDRRLDRTSVSHSGSYLEVLTLHRKVADLLLSKDIFLFHGAVVAVNGNACAFTAPSGTGKTTHVRLWRKLLGDRMTIVNGDKPLIRATEDSVTVYGTPWCGKEHYGTNTKAPLRALVCLERGEKNEIEEIRPREALNVLLHQTYLDREPEKMMVTLKLLDLLSKRVRFFRLRCNMDPEAAVVSYNALRDLLEG